MVCDEDQGCNTVNDFYALENVPAADKSISLSGNEITFSKCDSLVAHDQDCESDAYYKKFYIAVFVVLNDFQSTSSVNMPVHFRFAFGPRGCSSNTITSLKALSSDNTYRLKDNQVD